MSPDPIEQLAVALFQHYNPDPVDRLAKAVSAAFADQAAADGGGLARQLASADLQAQHRRWQARSLAKYGPAEAMADRLQGRGRPGLQGRVWC